MTEIDRRRFLGATAGAAALGASGALRAASPSNNSPAAAADRPPAPPIIKLGKTGIKMSRLGQGTGVHGGERQSDQTRMGFAKLVDLMHHAYDRGIRFFDLADLYGTHVYFREALKKHGAQTSWRSSPNCGGDTTGPKIKPACPSAGKWPARRLSDSATS